MAEVDDYVCLVESKRAALREIVRELQMFRDGRPRRHRSCLLIAPPGSGKTYLVSRLARSLHLRFLHFNITQMLSKHDILDCFDTIITTQFQSRAEGLLVFVDEVNAPLAGQEVYDAFLAPLESGVYVRAGKTFPIAPCAWVFAATKPPKAGTSSKVSDFVSRLTLEPVTLEVTGKEDDARLEKVYLGVALLRSEFPDVRRITEKVLYAF